MGAHVKGDRVGAILSASDKVVNLLGFGVYDGDCDINSPSEIVKPAGWLADAIIETALPHPNPRITLDSGEIVWGCECWWGDEEAVKVQIEKYKAAGFAIKEVSMAEKRKEFIKET